MQLDSLRFTAGRLSTGFIETYWNLATLLQLGMVALAALGAVLLGSRLEAALERRAHGIKGNADLLRLVIALIRRSDLLVFVLLLFGCRLMLLVAGVSTATLDIVLLLASAWLGLAVVARIVRNRTLARIIAVVAWIYIAIVVLGLSDATTTALEQTAINIGEIRITALGVLRTLVVTAIVIWGVTFVSRVIEGRLEHAEDVSASVRVLASKLVRIGLLVAGGAFALTATGVDLTTLTLVSGAIGVGIGFGLQKVVSNFISGIIILLDRSIKPGDTIELGETFGSIKELRARFVSVMTRDGRKYLIPNEDFITQQVINWSYSDHNVRIDVEFGVGYDSNPHQVGVLAIKATKSIQRVSAYKEPVCWLVAFGASSLDFKLRFWITDPENGLTNVRGQVLLALWDAFNEAGISIPFPQNDISFSTPLEVRSVRTDD
ncbi:mechanosensitive ion channel family protein [Pelagibacterium sp.]|uniref:mechanosensitive ion channel family protein n=1 Tax=Pelagibacterium sp. TaxID=1967288 RepID=UPI003A8F4A2B